MDLDISRLEEISTGDIGNFHATNAYRIGYPHSRQGTVLWISGVVALCPTLAPGS